MQNLMTYLNLAVKKKASDIFIMAGRELSIKKSGSIMPIAEGEDMLRPDDTKILVGDLYKLANRDFDPGVRELDDDFSIIVPDLARFRVNIFQQRNSIASVVRVVQFGIPDYRKIGIPEEVMKLAEEKRGMVLVTGAAGSGKSTSLACIVDAINHLRSVHIITIEDPIEHLHRNDKSIVTQRELSRDTKSYASALRASLRQAPDVILVGEMRDLDTIQTAMTAAETGHLVLSTLHTLGAANTIDRIIDVFPPEQQQQIRVQVSHVLHTVVSQQLLPSTDGDRVPAFEIMHLNNAIRTMIRDNRIHQVDSVIQTGKSEGMVTMDTSILELYKKGRITADVAREYAISPEKLEKRLR